MVPSRDCACWGYDSAESAETVWGDTMYRSHDESGLDGASCALTATVTQNLSPSLSL